MKALTVLQPWAWAIAQGLKTIENRSWEPNLAEGEMFLIHAGKKRLDASDTAFMCDELGADPEDLVYGAIVGHALYGGVIKSKQQAVLLKQGMYWEGPKAWVLNGIQRYKKPVPCAGQQGLWTPPPEVTRALRRRMAGLPDATAHYLP